MEILKISADQIAKEYDLQKLFSKLRKKNKKISINYYNHFLGKNKNKSNSNWLSDSDFINLFHLTDFEVIGNIKKSTISTITARPIPVVKKDYSVSIIIPARNEAGNIGKIIPSIPKFGKHQEFVFVEGGSSDVTWNEIKKVGKKYKNVKILKQKGKGKANAVRLGISKARGEMLMIYDADRTVSANDLTKFYDAISTGKGEFINGSRLVYPMEKDAMQSLNKIGNKIFSLLFTWIFGQKFKDTLCGTKAFLKKDYVKFKKFKDDPFGDFELIFGAIQSNLKVLEIPVRYKERVYGSTNINRFWHGLLLTKIAWFAFKKFRLN